MDDASINMQKQAIKNTLFEQHYESSRPLALNAIADGGDAKMMD
jgi:hypothetical protein